MCVVCVVCWALKLNINLNTDHTDHTASILRCHSCWRFFIDMPVRTYSSGMHLRLAFSVATVIRPEILIMDEWLAVGDESFKHKAESRMQKLVESTSILIIASHSKELLIKTCNRIILLDHGLVKMDSDPVGVCNKYFVWFWIFIIKDNIILSFKCLKHLIWKLNKIFIVKFFLNYNK